MPYVLEVLKPRDKRRYYPKYAIDWKSCQSDSLPTQGELEGDLVLEESLIGGRAGFGCTLVVMVRLFTTCRSASNCCCQAERMGARGIMV